MYPVLIETHKTKKYKCMSLSQPRLGSNTFVKNMAQKLREDWRLLFTLYVEQRMI